jgi:hypothetical protein
MEIDELPENDERLLKKPEIKRDEMGRFEPPNNSTGRRIQRWIGPFKNRLRELIAGVIALRKTGDQQQ